MFFKQIRKILRKIIHVSSVKLNVIDFIVIGVVALAFGFMLYTYFAKKTEWISVRIKAGSDSLLWTSDQPDTWYLKNLAVHDVAYNSFGSETAEVISIESIDVGRGKSQTYVDVNLKVSYEDKKKRYSYEYQPLQIGKPINLTFGKNNLYGLVTYIGSNNIEYVEKTIELKVLAVRDWVAKSYTSGLKVIDSSGATLAEIISVDRQPNQAFELYDARGRRLLIPYSDKNLSDVTFRLKLKAYEQNNTFYFIDGTPVRVGGIISFNFQQIAINNAEISQIFP